MFSINKKANPPLLNKVLDRESIVRLTHQQMTAGSGCAALNLVEKGTASASGDALTWDEIVFTGRNREYGSFVLRKGYYRNVLVGLLATVLFAVMVLFYPAIARFFYIEVPLPTPPLKKLVYSELSAPPPIDKPTPIPLNVQLPRLQKVVKFVSPKVVRENATEIVPTIEEIKVSETGTEEVEGPAEVVFDEPVEEVVAEVDEIFIVVDQQPEFEGGYEAMMAFIKQNMLYPANARRMKVEGTVHVSFVVSKTGEISDVRVLRGFMTECDKEAVRVIGVMPRWKPGKQNGRNVNVRFILPLKFKLG